MIWLLVIAALADPTPEDGPISSAHALELAEKGEPLAARRIAEEVLRQHPDDFVAHDVVAKVYWEEEGNLPVALYHFRRADTLYRAQKASLGKEAWRTHWDVLRGIVFVAEEMENYDLFHASVAAYNEMYNPKLGAEQAWSLMKEERFDEARVVAKAGLASENRWQQILAGNAMCALESKIHDRAASLRACTAALEACREAGEDCTVEAYNAATSRLAALDLSGSEELLQESTAGTIGGSTNPWTALSALYLSVGRGADAANAVKQMQRWRHHQEPSIAAQSRADADASLAALLMVAGDADRALSIMDRVLSEPDRRANTSLSSGATRAAHTILRRRIRRVQREIETERLCNGWFFQRAWNTALGWLPNAAELQDEVILAGIFADSERMVRTFSVYDDDGVPVALWMVGDLVEVLGAGVVSAAIDEARNTETYPGLPSYYLGLEAEAAWYRRASEVPAMVARALEGVPREEVLWRGRLAAIAADSAYRSGDTTTAMAQYERAMQLDPSVFRRLGVAIPATIRATGGEASVEAARRLGYSPRLRYDPKGFSLTVDDSQVCIRNPTGSQLGCYGIEGNPEDRAGALVNRFHSGAFALPLGLSRLDLQSLDGTTRLREQDRRDALDSVLSR